MEGPSLSAHLDAMLPCRRGGGHGRVRRDQDLRYRWGPRLLPSLLWAGPITLDLFMRCCCAHALTFLPAPIKPRLSEACTTSCTNML